MKTFKLDHRLERGKKTKQKLLLAALELIGASGLEGFSAHALARKAGVSKSLLYHHFANLDGVIPGVAEMLWHFMEQAMRGPRPATLKAYLERMGRLALDPAFYSKPYTRASIELYRRSIQDAVLRRMMTRLLERGLERVKDDLAGYTVNAAQRARSETVVALLLPLSDGLQMHLSVFGNRFAAQKAWNLAISQAENYILHGNP